MKLVENTTYPGKFDINGQAVDGELVLAGGNTKLRLYSPEFFRAETPDRYITGQLNDRSKVSLIQCAPTISGGGFQYGETYRHATVFAHFVLHGGRHLNPVEKSVRTIRFSTDDASRLFDDSRAFSFALRPRRFIRRLSKAYERDIGVNLTVGRHPEIAFFTGKPTIASATTAIGTVSVTHYPMHFEHRSDGFALKSGLSIDIDFPNRTVFSEATDAVLAVLGFLEVLAGRRQHLTRLEVSVGTRKNSESIDVYWSMPPERPNGTSHEPNSFDLPLHAAREPTVFAEVLTQWLSRHADWRPARQRFSDAFAQGRRYGADRLIGAANVFDLLPESALPPGPELSPDLLTAKEAARRVFLGVPPGPERDSVLGALGRIGHPSLRAKILRRASVVTERTDGFDKLPLVIELAVDCRNHFVHGSKPRLDYATSHFETVPFLTDTLEFIFGAADLCDAGWDIGGWRRRGTTATHPYGAYIANYPHYLARLTELLS